MKKKALRRELKLRTKHLDDLIKLRSKVSNIAIQKGENATMEWKESSNNKYALLKEQAGQFASKEEVETLKKMMYMFMGAAIGVQLIIAAIWAIVTAFIK
jgi:protein involved in polysaccharide export with SLBB domain